MISHLFPQHMTLSLLFFLRLSYLAYRRRLVVSSALNWAWARCIWIPLDFSKRTICSRPKTQKSPHIKFAMKYSKPRTQTNDRPRKTRTIKYQLQDTRHGIQTGRTKLEIRKQMQTYDESDFALPVDHDSAPDALQPARKPTPERTTDTQLQKSLR